MDNHPIPQDVTHFQFKLIGDLTIKQFGYLIASVLVAWFFFVLPILDIIKLPLSLTSLSIGVILAFVPFEGRPSDVMFMHFFKALFTPNQYTYQAGTVMKSQVNNTQPAIEKNEEQKPAEDKTVYFQSSPIPIPVIQQQQTTNQPAFVNPPHAPDQPQIQAQVTPLPTTPAVTAVAEQTLEQKLLEAKAQEAHATQGTQEATLAHQKVQELEAQLHEVFAQKQELEQQIIELKQQLTQKQQQQVFTPSDAPAQTTQTAHVIKVPKQLGKSIGLPITPDVPNLLTGIVKDPRGNILSNILIEVKDKDGNAVRAFKTNNLGQFASATPLLNGTYTVSFEDPAGKNSFDMV